ncbi:TolC family protein [Cytophagaceae bacterium ABcell3]|nr:TolC family protein [Cytophagaceae bacterium ABcell3]
MNRLILIFLLFFAFGVHAQESHEMTLQQCIDYALQNHASVKNAALDVNSADARVGEVRSVGLPQLSGTVEIADNPQLRRMFLSGDNPMLGTMMPTPPPPGEVVGVENLFQLRASGDAGGTLSQLLFDGSYFVGLKAATVYRELAQKSLTQTKIETIDAVTKAYYMVLINQERTGLLDNNLARLDTLLRETRAMYQEGFAEEVDVSRIEVNYNNLLVDKQRFENMEKISRLMLKFQMGMPMDDDISLLQSLDDFEGQISSERLPVNYEDRIEYSLLQTNHRLYNLDVRNEQAASLPRLSAFATGGYMTQHTSIPNLFSNEWYFYSMYGLRLNIPIFDGLGRMYRVRQAKYNVAKVENDIKNLENSIELQTREARMTLDNNLKLLEAKRRNLRLAQEVTRVTRIKYQEGVGSNLEVTTAENDLRQAQTNYYNALFDVLTADVDYRKALGTLNENE